MDALILIGSFILLMLVGMPVAYALGLAALIGAMWIDLPLDAVMIQMASGVNKFSLLAIPCFVLAGAIMAEGGMSRRLVAFAGVLIGSCVAACRWSIFWRPLFLGQFPVLLWPIRHPLARSSFPKWRKMVIHGHLPRLSP